MHTIRRHTITLAAGFLACCAIGVPAEPLAWLYDVQVPVASQTDAERQRATRHAFVEVLGRVTGSAQVPMTSAIAAALATPARYTRRYKFTSTTPEAGLPQPNGNALLFDVGFDPGAVLALLRDAQLPIWGANRPTVLVWLAVRGSGRNEVVAAGEANTAEGWAAALRKRARQRGVALALPLMDLRDLETPTAAVWGFFWEDIKAASGRYGADLVLVGRATLGHDGWWTDWELRQPARFDSATFAAGDEPPAMGSGLNRRYHHQAGTLQEAARAAVDEVADALAARFAVRGDSAHGYQATVYGAQTVRGYATLLDHLGAQEYIEQVDVLAATPRTLDLRLHTRSDIAQLAELLAQDDRLAVTSAIDHMELTWQDRE